MLKVTVGCSSKLFGMNGSSLQIGSINSVMGRKKFDCTRYADMGGGRIGDTRISHQSCFIWVVSGQDLSRLHQTLSLEFIISSAHAGTFAHSCPEGLSRPSPEVRLVAIAMGR